MPLESLPPSWTLTTLLLPTLCQLTEEYRWQDTNTKASCWKGCVNPERKTTPYRLNIKKDILSLGVSCPYFITWYCLQHCHIISLSAQRRVRHLKPLRWAYWLLRCASNEKPPTVISNFIFPQTQCKCAIEKWRDTFYVCSHQCPNSFLFCLNSIPQLFKTLKLDNSWLDILKISESLSLRFQ